MKLFDTIVLFDVFLGLILIATLGAMFYKLHQKRKELEQVEDAHIISESTN